jgi:hypothetical protein
MRVVLGRVRPVFNDLDDSGKLIYVQYASEAVEPWTVFPVGVLDSGTIRPATSTEEANHYLSFGKNRRGAEFEAIYYISINGEWIPATMNAIQVYSEWQMTIQDLDTEKEHHLTINDGTYKPCPNCNKPLIPESGYGPGNKGENFFKKDMLIWCPYGCGSAYKITYENWE